MKRAPEEVIRVKVIEEGLISEAEFARALAVMDARSRMNARVAAPDGGRFTYNGFLLCAACGQLLYTHFRRRDYYVCKGRRLGGPCGTAYMRREQLDPKLDEMFAERLSDEGFWRAAASELLGMGGREAARDTAGLAAELSRLEARRARARSLLRRRVEREERDGRLRQLDGEMAAVRSALEGSRPPEYPDAFDLAELFEVFDDFTSLSRLQNKTSAAGSNYTSGRAPLR